MDGLEPKKDLMGGMELVARLSWDGMTQHSLPQAAHAEERSSICVVARLVGIYNIHVEL